jgi:DNA-directed RNA polymerase subunit M/transcription elongation factor TFIIS
MDLAAVLCSACSNIGFARADALPRVLTCSRCHRQQRFESRPLQRRLAKRDDALWQHIDELLEEPCEI